MKIIANGINGIFLNDILSKANVDDTSFVKAAIAYADMSNTQLLDFCYKNDIKLEFWGRLDETIPVPTSFLKKLKSYNFKPKLIWKHYHPKILWIENIGVYIGSANLTDNGWVKNIECGIFITHYELVEENLLIQIEHIFDEIDQHSFIISEPLLNLLVEFERNSRANINKIDQMKASIQKEFEKEFENLIPRFFQGLTIVNKKTTLDKKKELFLDEWNKTVDILTGLQEVVTNDSNRPKWINPNVPRSVQVDQFLHAYYYNCVMEKNRSRHEEFYEKSKNDIQGSLEHALSYWRNLERAPSDEDKFMHDWAPFIKKSFSRESLLTLSKEDFLETIIKIHAFVVAARQAKKKDIGLPPDSYLEKIERAKYVGSLIFDSRSKKDMSPLQLIHYILYEGNQSKVVERIWEAVYGDYHIKRLGLGTIGEIVGWAMPDVFPPRNGRTSKALKALGHDVTIYTDT